MHDLAVIRYRNARQLGRALAHAFHDNTTTESQVEEAQRIIDHGDDIEYRGYIDGLRAGNAEE